MSQHLWQGHRPHSVSSEIRSKELNEKTKNTTAAKYKAFDNPITGWPK